MYVAKNDIPVTTHLLPGASQNEPVIQIVQYTNALEPQRGQCSIHAFGKRPRRQSQAEGQDLLLVSLFSKSEPKESPVSLNDLDVKVRILQVDGDKPVSLLDLRHDGFYHQHLELPFVEGKLKRRRSRMGLRPPSPFG